MSCTGSVKKWVPARGFGFITNNADQGDVFVHFKAISNPNRKSLNIGEKVTFDTEIGEKGPKAVNVTGDGTGTPAPEEPSSNGRQQQQPRYGMQQQQVRQPAGSYGRGYGVQQQPRYGMQQQQVRQPAGSYGRGYAQPQQQPQQVSYLYGMQQQPQPQAYGIQQRQPQQGYGGVQPRY